MKSERTAALSDRNPQGDLRERVGRFIEAKGLMKPGDVVVVAVSGGVDSVFLLETLVGMASSFPLRLHVGHVNHGLRGEESDADARFVADLASRVEAPFHLRTQSLSHHSPKGKPHASPESEWRDARYGALREIAEQVNASCVALGHNQDDLAETVLMRLMRGCGLEGLAAFGPLADAQGLRLCRPLIATSRSEIERFARDHGWRWREDPSNQDMGRTRNRIRRGLLPYMRRRFNPAIDSALARTAELAGCENAFVEKQADAVWRGWMEDARRDGGETRDESAGEIPEWLGLSALQACPPALLRRLLRRWVMAVSEALYPPTFEEIQGLYHLIFSGRTGSCYEYHRRWRFQKTRTRIIATRTQRQKRENVNINSG